MSWGRASSLASPVREILAPPDPCVRFDGVLPRVSTGLKPQSDAELQVWQGTALRRGTAAAVRPLDRLRNRRLRWTLIFNTLALLQVPAAPPGTRNA